MSWANTKKYRAYNLTCPIHPRHNLAHNQDGTPCTGLALPSRCRSPRRIWCSRNLPPQRKNLRDTSCTSKRVWSSRGTQAGRTDKPMLLLSPERFPWGTLRRWDSQTPQQSSLQGIPCSSTQPVRSLLLRDCTLCSWIVLSRPDTGHVDTACKLECRILQRNGLSRTSHSEVRRCGSQIGPVGRDSTWSLLLHPEKTHVDNTNMPACHRLGHTSQGHIRRSLFSPWR
mmetsp:Transcript_47811/g.97297  ORF Transcript_47811/g.97297 Transcript_47811/m.97297 type:complete len:227 (+) Transcript_47811:58-738(+)